MQAGNYTILEHVPESPEGQHRYLFYLHGLIVEEAGIRPKSEEHGYYEYERILEALAQQGFIVISEARGKGTQVKPYAEYIAAQIKKLLAGGVAPGNIIVVGASKGGVIGAYVSNILQEKNIHYVLLSGLFEKCLVDESLKLYGNVLSIHDRSDKQSITPALYFQRSAGLGEFKEIALDLGIGHGLIYQPNKAWLDPMLQWVQPGKGPAPGERKPEKVYFIEATDNEEDEFLCAKLRSLLQSESLLDCIADQDVTAVKTHFGESQKLGYARPLYLKMLGEGIKGRGGVPFLTETSTLYKGNRSGAIRHIAHAHSQGFDYAATGMPIIMADGLFGDEECVVPISGKAYSSVHIAALFAKCNALVMVSHFTGHLAAGFGATLKNLGMGCASRKGKMAQHSTAKPKIVKKKCTGCGTCVTWCPATAITMKEESAVISARKCIGCGECLAMCRFDAVKFDWGATYEDLQKKVVEHAMGVCSLFPGKSLFINVLTRISKDCDCMGHTFEKIVPDIGILVSRDPVALDAASLALVEKQAGAALSQLAYDIPYRFQLDYARELDFGNPEYELIGYSMPC